MDLFGIVEEYAALGSHRTGTPVDDATVEWIGILLRELGLQVTTEPLTFDRWDAESTLLANGEPVEHLPVFYEFTGDVRTTAPRIVAVDPLFGGFPGVLAEPVAQARDADAEALIVATEHPDGSLVAVNRVPGGGSGFPTVLVAGRDHDRLANADVELDLRAREVEGRSATVVGRNDVPGRPLLITTPLTGWFGCAGERGTGIAVLLDLVTRLGDRPLLVVATTGHELDYLGARRWLPTAGVECAAVVHLGASIGVEEDAGDGIRRLATTRRAMTNLAEDAAAPLTQALRPAALDLSPSTDSWIGEAEVFCSLDVPLLSISGAGVDFHTPGDLPDRVTSPEAMRTAADAVHAAAVVLDDHVRPDHPTRNQP